MKTTERNYLLDLVGFVKEEYVSFFDEKPDELNKLLSIQEMLLDNNFFEYDGTDLLGKINLGIKKMNIYDFNKKQATHKAPPKTTPGKKQPRRDTAKNKHGVKVPKGKGKAHTAITIKGKKTTVAALKKQGKSPFKKLSK